MLVKGPSTTYTGDQSPVMEINEYTGTRIHYNSFFFVSCIDCNGLCDHQIILFFNQHFLHLFPYD